MATPHGPRPVRFLVIIAACATVLVARSRAFADPPDVAAIVSKMKAAMAPTRSTVSDIRIETRGSDGSTVSWLVEQARAKTKSGAAVLTVVTSPDDVKGNALLIREEPDGHQSEWMYIPAVRRVRKLVYASRNQTFLGTDLTYEDLGLIQPANRWYTLVREEKYKGKETYVVREDPADKSLYSRVEVWIAADSFLPLKREYYDPAGLLWRVAEYATPTVIEGVPTVLTVSLKDVQEGGSTTLTVDAVRVARELTDTLFDPDNLPHAVESGFWNKK